MSWLSYFSMCVQTLLFCLHTSPSTYPCYSCYFWLWSRAQDLLFCRKKPFFCTEFLEICLPSVVLNVRLMLYLNKNACFQNVPFSSLPKGSTVRLPSDAMCWSLAFFFMVDLNLLGKTVILKVNKLSMESPIKRFVFEMLMFNNDGCNYYSEGVKSFRSFSVISKEHKYIWTS